MQQAGGEHDAGGPRGQGRRGEVADLVDQALRDRRLLGLGDFRRGVHDVQPPAGVTDVGGQLGQHGRHLVAQRPLAGRIAHRDRDHRDERLRRQRVVIDQPAPQGARAHRHHHVVD